MNSTTTGVALVGYGYWGANLARNIVAAENLRLIGVVDSSQEQRKAAEEAIQALRTWGTLQEALDDADVQAVVLATPAGTHASLALHVLASGRDVLVEKPLALTVSEAEQVASAAEASGRIVMVGHTFLYSTPVLRLREYLHANDLGKVHYLYSQRLSLGRIRRDCSALWNFAPHDVSIMLYLLGDRPVEVSGRGFSFLQQGIDDVVFASMQFASGVGANLHLSWIDPRKVRLLTIVGDEKMAVYDDVATDRPITIYDAGVAKSETPGFGEYQSMGDFQWRTRSGDISIPRVPLVEPLLSQMRAFGEACQTRELPLTNVQHGWEVVRVLDAIDRSCRKNGAPVRIKW